MSLQGDLSGGGDNKQPKAMPWAEFCNPFGDLTVSGEWLEEIGV